MSCCYTNRIHTVYYVLITVALFELHVYITLWPSGLYICFHGLHESHTNKFISSSSSSSSSLLLSAKFVVHTCKIKLLVFPEVGNEEVSIMFLGGIIEHVVECNHLGNIIVHRTKGTLKQIFANLMSS